MGTDITVTTATRPASGRGQITPEPYVQHSDVLGSPSQGPLEASAVAAIARLPDLGAAPGGLVLAEIKTTIPADNMPPPSSFQPPVQVSVTGVDLGHPGLGPLATARLVSGRAFAPDLHIRWPAPRRWPSSAARSTSSTSGPPARPPSAR